MVSGAAGSLRQRLYEATGQRVRVALIDSMGEVLASGSQVPGGLPPRTPIESEHGLLCSRRVRALAPGVEIVPVEIFRGRSEASVSDVCRGIVGAIEANAQVLNISLATRSAGALEQLYAACEWARRQGAIVVASAPNGGGEGYPASFEPALSACAAAHRQQLDFTYTPGAQVECVVGTAPTPRELELPSLPLASSSLAAATMSAIVARIVELGVSGLDPVRETLALLSTPAT